MALFHRRSATARRSLWQRRGTNLAAGAARRRALLLEHLEGRLLLSSNPIITEFLAANNKGLKDASGENSDWIEIYNPDSQTAVDMTGWSLKYDGAPWTFPSSLFLGPGEFRIVFCTKPDPKNPITYPSEELHATFNLNAAGNKKLQLLNPSGVEVSGWSSLFGYPNGYPAQTTDVSYGVGQEVTETKLIDSGATAKYYVPANAALGTTWTQQTGFDDSLWASGATGLGMTSLTPGFAVNLYKANIPVVHVDAAISVIDTFAYQSWSKSETVSTLNYLNFGGAGRFASDRAFPGLLNGSIQTDYVVKANGVVHIPTAGNWTFCVNSDDGFQMSINGQVFAFDGIRTAADTFRTVNFASAGDYDLSLLYFQHTAAGELEVSVATGVKTSWDSSFRLLGDTTGNYPSVKSAAATGQTTSGLFAGQIKTNVQSVMATANSMYVRVPFTVDAATLASLSTLTLKMKYDDGYVAWLNGTEIARRSAPTTVTYNALATAARNSDLQCTTFENVDVTSYRSLLTSTGNNVLAIQVMKSSASDLDLLVVPELSRIVSTQLDEHFFATPTPDAANTQDTWKADVAFSATHGFYDQPLQVTLTSNIAGSDIWYTTDGSDPAAPNLTKSVSNSGPAVSVTGISCSGTTTFTATATAPDHGFITGQTITISGATPVVYNGTFTIANVTQNTFTYTLPSSAGSSAGGTARTCGLVCNGVAATVTLANHGYLAGNLVLVSGATQADYNGVFSITSATQNTFAYVISVSSPVTPATGTISVVKVDRAVAGITCIDTTATVTAYNHGFYGGDFIRISGATQAGYNGDFVITNVTQNTFDITVTESPVTPATGNMAATRVSHKYTTPLAISTTTVLRAAAAPSGGVTGVSATETYLFANDIISQPAGPPGFPTTWGSGTNATAADYQMDPRITTGATALTELRAGLMSVPSVSIVTSKAGLFDLSTGIYANPTADLTTGGSLEYFDPDDAAGFQINAAVRVYGNIGRTPSFKKHSIRVNFKAPYGPSKLNYPFFPDSSLDEYDVIIFKAACGDAWIWGGSTVQYIRDANAALTQLAMGDISHHVKLVNLYIDGLYWGLYCATERPDGKFASAYLGGDDGDWEAINEGAAADNGAMDSWTEMMAKTTAGFTTTSYQAGKPGFNVTTYQAGYDSASPGFTTTTYVAAAGVVVNSLATADSLINTPANQTSTTTATTATVNYMNTGTDGHYTTGNLAFPGTTIGTQLNNFVVNSTADVYIPAAGTWTFGVSSDDGCRLMLTNGTTTYYSNFYVDGTRTSPTDKIVAFNITALGTYSLTLEYYQNTGGASVELFAAQGNYTGWSTPGGANWQLVGDTTHGGLAAYVGIAVTTLADADSVIANTSKQAWTSTATSGTINYRNTGLDGNSTGNVSFPGTTYGSLVRNIVVNATSTIYIPTIGAWTFYVNSDDGFRLTLSKGGATYPMQYNGTRTAPVGTFSTFNITTFGTYSLTLEYFQNTLGAELELWAAKGTYTSFPLSGSTFQLVGNSASGGLTSVTATVAVNALADAESILATPANRAWTNTQNLATLNCLSTGMDGHFNTNNLAFPSAGANSAMTVVGSYIENFVVEARSNVYIPAAGLWTFGVNSDDGFRLVLANGPDVFTCESDGTRDALQTFNIPRAGAYSVRLLYFQSTSGGQLEFYAAQGSFTTYSQTNTWRLVGDQANGGLFASPYNLGFDATLYRANIAVADIATAESVIGDPAKQVSITTQTPATINYLMSGTEGRYGTNSLFPGVGTADTSTNFVVDATSYVYFPSAGYWTFGVNSDDGFKLTLTSGSNVFTASYVARETLPQFNIPAAGMYSLHLEYYQNTADAELELYAAQGQQTAFSSTLFHLVGDTANQGLLASTYKMPSANDMYYCLQGLNPDGSRNPNYANLMDMSNYINYMIANLFLENGDWPGHNFYADRLNTPESTGFKYIMWDEETTLGLGDNPNQVNATVGVAQMYAYLRNSSEFRMRFADRVYDTMYNGGVLTSAVVAARYSSLASTVEQAIICESARWGDFLVPNAPHTAAEWRTERDRVMGTVIPARTNLTLQLLRTAGMYPAIDPPVFNVNGTAQYGGLFNPNDVLTMTATGGTIYYTLDGTDPRPTGGGAPVLSGGNIFAYGGQITADASMTFNARVYNSSTGEWSALAEPTFYLNLAPSIRITEIMYNPAPRSDAEKTAEFTDDSQFEYIEIKNIGAAAVSLAGLQFSNGVTFTFPDVVIGAGEYRLVVSDSSAFSFRYPSVNPLLIVGTFAGSLNNAGEKIELDAPNGGIVHDFTYSDGWYSQTDGEGFSLTVRDPLQSLSKWDKDTGWRNSAAPGGSPGTYDTLTPPGSVIINEVLAHTDPSPQDMIEFYNTTDQAIDLAGWFVSDDASNLMKYKINSSYPGSTTVIQPGGYLVLTQDKNFGLDSPDSGRNVAFALSEHGDSVYLSSNAVVSGTTVAGGYREHVDFAGSINGFSQGLTTKSTGGTDFTLLQTPTFGTPVGNVYPGGLNSVPYVTPLAINEILYHPGAPTTAAEAGFTADQFEFIELYNRSSTPLTLRNYYVGDGVGYTFGWIAGGALNSDQQSADFYSHDGSTVFVTTDNNHGFATGDIVQIDGAQQPAYNGDFVVTVDPESARTFSYTISGTPASPEDGNMTVRTNKNYQTLESGATATWNKGGLMTGNYTVYAHVNLLDGDGNRRSDLDSAAQYLITYLDGTETQTQTVVIDQNQLNLKGDGAAITLSGTTATVTLAGHGFTDGSLIHISGADQPEYNGDFTIRNVTADTFDYTPTITPTTSPATGSITVRRRVGGITPDDSTATVHMPHHGFANGDVIHISGADQAVYNGDFTISNVMADTFDYTMTGVATLAPNGTITAWRDDVWVNLGTYDFSGLATVQLTRGSTDPGEWTMADQVKLGPGQEVLMGSPDELSSPSVTRGITTVAPGGYVVLVADYAAFNARYGISANNIPVAGTYSGQLSNSGEAVRLYQIGHWDAGVVNVDDGFVPTYQIDHVNYDNQIPWPTDADATGAALSRLHADQYGNDPINWGAANVGGTPGTPNLLNDQTPPSIPEDITAHIQTVNTVHLDWLPAHDYGGTIGHYVVYRNGLAIGTSATTSYDDSDVQPVSSYSYQVAAVNHDLHSSALSKSLGVTVPGVASYYLRDSRTIEIDFTEALNEVPAKVQGNYDFYEGTTRLTVVPELARNRNNTKVILTTAADMVIGNLYTVTLHNLTLASGNLMADGLQVPFTFGFQPTGSILREYWNAIPGTQILNLTGNAKYPSEPSGTSYPTSLAGPSNWADYYGTRLRGYVYPPQTGNYTFWLTADDSGELWLSTDDSAAKRKLIAYVSSSGSQTQSALIGLTAGKRYYIEVLQKEYGGTDGVSVRWQLPDGSYENNDPTLPIPGRRLSPYGQGPDSNPPSIPENLRATISIANSRATLRWDSAVDLAGGVHHYVIYRDSLPYGTSNSTSTTITIVPSEGRHSYQVSAVNSEGFEGSRSASISVVAPGVLMAGATSLTTVTVVFTEPVDRATAQSADNYKLPGVNVSAASLASDNLTVTLTTSPLTFSKNYTVTVNGVYTAGGIALAANQQGSFAYGWAVLREYWLGLGSGTAITDLTGSTNYPNAPTGFDYWWLFEAPANTVANGGQRMRAYVYPPVTGNYTFWVAGAGSAQLYLSTNETAANKALIASASVSTTARQWNKSLLQQSASISLVAGQAYYIEAVQKTGATGDGNLAVAWQPPGTIFNTTSGDPILGCYLSPYVDPPSTSGVTLTVNSQSTINTSPALSGVISNPNKSVTVSVTGTTTGGEPVHLGFFAATINGNSTWTVPAGLIQPPLGDGTYQITACATDASGKLAFDTSTSELIVEHVPPTADIIDVEPDSRNTAVDSITIRFSEPIFVLQLLNLRSSLLLTRNGNSVSLDAATLNPIDSQTWTLGNLSDATPGNGTYEYELKLTAAGSSIIDVAGNSMTADATESWLTTGAAGAGMGEELPPSDDLGNVASPQVGGTGVTPVDGSPWQNAIDRWDVNGDGVEDSLDESVLTNALVTSGPREVSQTVGSGSPWLDVNGDLVVNWLDLLSIHAQLRKIAAPLSQAAASPLVATSVVTTAAGTAPIATTSLETAVQTTAVQTPAVQTIGAEAGRPETASSDLELLAAWVAQGQRKPAQAILDEALNGTVDWRLLE